MLESLYEKVRRWARIGSSDADYYSILSYIDYVANRLFREYEPTQGANHPSFQVRLTNWISSPPLEEDQQTLLRLLKYLYFIGINEFNSIYRAAFNHQVARWLVDQCGIVLDAQGAQDQLMNAKRRTWFCAVTDSMDIAKFYHLNNIGGVNYRPTWHSLYRFSSDQGLNEAANFMAQNDFDRLVLLEDFVGSGEQIRDTITACASLLDPIPILLVPLVVSPGGVITLTQLQGQHANLTFAPSLVLPDEAFINQTANVHEPELFQSVRNLVISHHHLVRGSNWPQDYGPFGFQGPDPIQRGGLVVMYTNCPDNTLPIIHRDSDGPWHALFPRSSRL